MESLLDELAYKIGMDPVEFRKKNMKGDIEGRLRQFLWIAH